MMHCYLDGKLRCKLCGQRVPAQLMTAVVRPCGKRQYYCPPCEKRRWADAAWRAIETPAPVCVRCGRAYRPKSCAGGLCPRCYIARRRLLKRAA